MPIDPDKRRPKIKGRRLPAKQKPNDAPDFNVYYPSKPLTPEQRLWPLIDFSQNPPKVVKPRGVDLEEFLTPPPAGATEPPPTS